MKHRWLGIVGTVLPTLLHPDEVLRPHEDLRIEKRTTQNAIVIEENLRYALLESGGSEPKSRPQ